jgi:branched-chain amino acid transport system ATP-binding protein
MPDLPVFAVENLQVRYGTTIGIENVSLAVRKGAVLAVVGANGAGKSTLARACAGLVPTAGGRVLLDGRRISGQQARKIRQAGVVYLPEGRGIFPTLSVQDNLRMAVRSVRGRHERAESLRRAFDLFPFLRDRGRQHAGSLSGGEQQMLALVRALATEPRVVIADELSLGLAPKMVSEVFDSLSHMKELGITMIVIEQFAHRVLQLADECTILRRGLVAWHGQAVAVGDDLLEHYLGH